LECVLTLDPGNVVRSLVHILDAELGRVWIGPNLRQRIVERDVGKNIGAGEGEISGGKELRVAVEANSELVGQLGSEEVVFTEGHHMVAHWNCGEEGGDVAGEVGGIVLLVDVANAYLVPV